MPAHTLKQQREVMYILRPVGVAGTRLVGIFPVEIDAVKTVIKDKLSSTGGKNIA